MRLFNVAIIEDSAMLRDMLTDMLGDIDRVNVAVTASGQQAALQALESCPVDLAIVDLELDEGNGLGVIETLHRQPTRFGKPRTVVFSNYAVSPMSRRCRELGVDRIYDKSFQLPELISYVKSEVREA
jgi:two-component system OmpR family response regulator